MTLEEYHAKLKSLRDDYRQDKHALRLKYVDANAKFKVGDFIGHHNKIIEVEAITYNYNKMYKTLNIMYYGKRYRMLKGKLIPAKEKRYNPMLDENFCHLITVKVIINNVTQTI